jgi:hypothetical protein
VIGSFFFKGVSQRKKNIKLNQMQTELLNYELLSKEFHGRGSQKGWMFIELMREGNAAVYEKEDSDTGRIVYEVVEVQMSKGWKGMIGGKEVEFVAKERYPSDEDFGSLGWTYGSMSDAEEKFEWLKSRIADRQKSNDSVLRVIGV